MMFREVDQPRCNWRNNPHRLGISFHPVSWYRGQYVGMGIPALVLWLVSLCYFLQNICYTVYSWYNIPVVRASFLARRLCLGCVSCYFQQLNGLCVPSSSCRFSLRQVQRLCLYKILDHPLLIGTLNLYRCFNWGSRTLYCIGKPCLISFMSFCRSLSSLVVLTSLSLVCSLTARNSNRFTSLKLKWKLSSTTGARERASAMIMSLPFLYFKLLGFCIFVDPFFLKGK